jgi:hypothetical protein
MKESNFKQYAIILTHAFVLWALCGAVMGIGPSLMPMETTLIVHAVAAPLFAAAVTAVYYRFFGYTTPWQTAIAFTAFIVAMDAIVVAMIVMRSFEMFSGFIGTWLPFMLIFASSYLTGSIFTREQRVVAREA